MILLVWNCLGEEALKFYEFPDNSDGARLAQACHEHYINSADNNQEMDDDLDRLYQIICPLDQPPMKPMPTGDTPHGFGPYSAIYTLGFIP
jgi:hypothetical protein